MQISLSRKLKMAKVKGYEPNDAIRFKHKDITMSDVLGYSC